MGRQKGQAGGGGGGGGGGVVLCAVLSCVCSFVVVHADSRKLHQTADKKTIDTKKVVPPTAGVRTARASLAGPKVTADKAKKAPVNKRKTLANPVPDKWADDETTTINDQDGSKMSVHERLHQIRTEHCCSLGEARRILWKVCSEHVAPARACIPGTLTMWASTPLSCTCEQNTWGTSATQQTETLCVQPARPVDPVADQFVQDEITEDGGQDIPNQRASSAPNTPSRAKPPSAEAQDKASTDDFAAIDTPSKFPAFAATPGERTQSTHVLLTGCTGSDVCGRMRVHAHRQGAAAALAALLTLVLQDQRGHGPDHALEHDQARHRGHGAYARQPSGRAGYF